MRTDAYLSIDFGNSSTRFQIKFKDENGDYQVRLRELSKRYGYLDDTDLYLVEGTDYNERNSKVFRYKNEIVCIGRICSTECGTNCVKPTSTDKKYESKYSRYALRLAIMDGFMEIAKTLGTSIEDLDVTWHIASCIPASDQQSGRERMENLLIEVADETLDFLIPNVTKRVKIAPNTKVRPESMTAYVGTVFETPKMFRYGMKAVASTDVLVIDMGDGTTDICAIEKGLINNKSLHSIAIGGSTITNLLKKEMEHNHGLTFSLDAMQESSITGELKIGNRVFDIASEVDRIRRNTARTLANQIKTYFDSMSKNIDEINYILLCGGGAEEDHLDKMNSYAHYIREELRGMMKYVDFLELPTVKSVDNNGNETLSKIQPRLLNVMGLGILNSPEK